MLSQTIVLLCAALTAAVPVAQSIQDVAASSSYWLSSIQRQGAVAYGNGTTYKVFRNVFEYGAKGDGVTDDSAAIQQAIMDGNRCGNGCDSSTITPALVYFPPGKYLLAQPVVMYYYTQLVGDALNPPSLIAAPSFQGLAMLDADPYIPGGYGAQWYTNQNNFFRQVRNFIIDLTQLPETQATNGIHWQVAQATSLQNIVFNMKPKSSSNAQVGVFIENGSGGFISDLIFNGGNIGMNIGSQQFTTRNVTFNNCNVAVYLLWDWLWTFKSLMINNCNVGMNMSSINGTKYQTVGSSVVMDSAFVGTPIGIMTSFNLGANLPVAGGTLVLQNIDFTGSAHAVTDAHGNQILAGGQKVASWAQGDVYLPAGNAEAKRSPQAQTESTYEVDVVTETVSVFVTATVTEPYSEPTSTLSTTSAAITNTISTSFASVSTSPTSASIFNTSSAAGNDTGASAVVCTASAVPVSFKQVQQGLTPPSMPSVLLDNTGAVFQKSKPQYETYPVSAFISVKSAGAKGDGQTDDSNAIQSVLNSATSGQIVYFDHGAYVITKTIHVPKNIRITGEIWPLIMISGSFFQDVNNPQPAFRIGNPGDTGTVEISDLIFETLGPAPGAIMMQWNVAQSSQGSTGMWDTHFRVGGTAGTQLTDGNCKAGDSTVFKQECAGSFLMMQITQQASAYLENTWFWLADHDLDTAAHGRVTVYNGRGILIDSKGPTWLYGTASEHNVFYNYQFANAQNVFMGAIQTETAYFQAAPDALSGGFTPNPAYSDPIFADCTSGNCKKTWGLRIVNSQDIYMYGGGLYSFFEDYDQTCLATESCQQNMVDLQCSHEVYLYGLVTKASTNMVNVNGHPAAFQKDNTNLFGATVALFEQH